MHLASPNVRKFLVLHLLLFLFGLGLQARMNESGLFCTGIIDEILDDLRKHPSSNMTVRGISSVDHEDRLILKDPSLLRENLHVFQKTLKTIEGNSSKIWKNLQGFEQCLPSGTAKGHPVAFMNSSWDEFRNKLTYYLRELRPKPWLMKDVKSVA